MRSAQRLAMTVCVVGMLCLTTTGQEPKPTTQPSLADPNAVVGLVQAAREDIGPLKLKIINETMRLGDAEAERFWPIYRQYEKESQAAGDEMVHAVKRILETMPDGKLDDNAASALSEAFLKFQVRRTELLRKYNNEVSQKLSPVHGAQFLQIEHRIRVAIDTHLAADMPLISKQQD